MTLQRRSLRSAPAVLNTADKAVWVTGWNEAVDALEAEQAQSVDPISKPSLYIHKDQLAFLRTVRGDESAQARYANGFPSWIPDSVKAEFLPLFAHPAPPPAGERAELIAKLRSIESRHLKIEGKVPLEMLDFYIAATLGLHHDANMLEADAVLADKRVDAIAADRDYWREQAQQVAVPMTREQLADAWIGAAHIRHATDRQIAYGRAIEAHHKIGAKP